MNQTSYIIIGTLIGIGVSVFVYQIGIKLLRRFLSNAKLIKNYWIFVTIFATLNVLAYYIIFSTIPDNREDIISVTNQASGLIFAIFTGFFAFSEIMENRFEKLRNEGMERLRAQDYTDAIKLWEDALAIKRRDYDTLGNLIEAYIIKGKYVSAEDRLKDLKKVVIPERKIITPILVAMMRIFQTHISEANQAIADVVEDMKLLDRRTYYPKWDFEQAVDCPAYSQLTGDAKKLFDNLQKYIEASMTDEERTKFENGNYLLN